MIVLRTNGPKIRQWREKRGFSTQELFADACKLGVRTIAKLEAGKKNVRLDETLATVARTLRVPIFELVHPEDVHLLPEDQQPPTSVTHENQTEPPLPSDVPANRAEIADDLDAARSTAESLDAGETSDARSAVAETRPDEPKRFMFTYRPRLLIGIAAVMLVIGAVVAIQVRPTPKDIAYASTFDHEKDCTFKLLEPSPSDMGCRDGVFFIRKGRDRQGQRGSVSLGLLPRDFDLRLKLRVKNASFFVGFRGMIDGTTATRVQLNMPTDGRWVLERESIPGDRVPKVLGRLGGWEDNYVVVSATRLPATEWATLRIVADGTEIIMYINGQKFSNHCIDEFKPSTGILPAESEIVIGIYEHSGDAEAVFELDEVEVKRLRASK